MSGRRFPTPIYLNLLDLALPQTRHSWCLLSKRIVIPSNSFASTRMHPVSKLYVLLNVLLSWGVNFNWMYQLHQASLGLRYLHSQFVVHGDLKAVCLHYRDIRTPFLTLTPQANILIAQDGSACLADFGLSRVKYETTKLFKPDKRRQIAIGTVRWMAPEQLDGHPASRSSDIYSFAMTIIEVRMHPAMSGITRANSPLDFHRSSAFPGRIRRRSVAQYGVWWDQTPFCRCEAGGS